MKTSNKLLIIGFLLILCGVFYSVFQLKNFLGEAFDKEGITVDVKLTDNVSEKSYEINEFEEINVTGGISAKIYKSDSQKIVLRGDSALFKYVEIHQSGGYLSLELTKIKGKKVRVEADIFTSNLDIDEININAGAKLTSDETIETSDLEIQVNAGAQLRLKVNCKSVECSSNAGAQAKLEGVTDKFDGSANAGAFIKAKNLKARKVKGSANAGGQMFVYASERIDANCLAGGILTYYGNPQSVNKSTLAGGVVKKGD